MPDPNVVFDARGEGGSSGASAPTAQATERDLAFYKTLAAGLQLEVDRLTMRQKLALEVLRTLMTRYRTIVAECDRGAIIEHDAVRRLDNLASAAFHSIDKLSR